MLEADDVRRSHEHAGQLPVGENRCGSRPDFGPSALSPLDIAVPFCSLSAAGGGGRSFSASAMAFFGVVLPHTTVNNPSKYRSMVEWFA